MVEIARRKRLTVPVAPVAAGGVAAAMALVFMLLPNGLLDALILDSGIPAIIPAAEPPLGFTARVALALIGGGGLGLITWFAAYVLIGARAITMFAGSDAATQADVPVLRRADAHPDAPARRPLFANSDLGTPFLEVRAPVHIVAQNVEDAVFVPAPPLSPQPTPVVRAAPPEAPLPVDLDQPLAAFDPHAIPEKPLEWFIPPAPAKTVMKAAIMPPERPQTFTPVERFESFELQPAEANIARARRDFDPSASIHTLLDRLEKGVTRREAQILTMPASVPARAPIAPRHDSLQDALSTLRRLATN